jgi:ABC-type transporter Mla MlaB component
MTSTDCRQAGRLGRTPAPQHIGVMLFSDPATEPMPTVRLSGHLDATAIPALVDALVAAAAGGALLVDATGVRSWDATALRALALVRKDLDAERCTVHIVGFRWNQVVDLLLGIPLIDVPAMAATVRELQLPGASTVRTRRAS